MTVLYIIAIAIMSLSLLWSAFKTVALTWEQEAGGAVGSLLAFIFNGLIMFLLFDGLLNR